MLKITRKFIAEKAGISPTAVSDILNKNPKARISSEARERVLKIAREYNYVPDAFARSLVMRRTFNVGLMYKASLFNFLGDPFTQEVFLGIESELERSEYSLAFSILKNPVDLNPSAYRMLHGNSVDGIVLCGAIDERVLDAIEAKKIHYVLVDYSSPNRQANSVMPDNVRGAYEAIRHLLADGRRSIVCLNGISEDGGHPSYIERPEGYFKALREASLKEHIVLSSPDTDSAKKTVESFLASNGAPDAFFATGDHMAIGCLKALQEANISVPGQTRVIGFDDIKWAETQSPPLSTVHVPKMEMGREAVRLLINGLEGESELRKSLRLNTRLMIRGT